MQREESLSTLIGDIYDAALDAARWPEVLGKIVVHANGHAAGLLSKDSVSKIGDAHYYHGVDEHFIRLYRETYWRFDPLAPLIFAAVGQVTSRRDFISDDEFEQGRFQREWLKPQGWADAANIVLEKSVTSCSILSVIRNEAQGLVDDDMRRRLSLIAPHVRRAVLIGKVINLKTIEAATLADTLDGLSAAMFLVNGAGSIVHANMSGHKLLAEGVVLRVVGGKLTTPSAGDEQALHDLFAAAGRGDAAVGTRGIAINLTTPSGEHYAAHLLPLTAGARRHAGETYSAVAAVFVQEAALQAPSAPEIIAKTYDLTPTELRVLLGIVEVGGVPGVSETLGIAESTVKTHLGRLYEKTGSRRHADLVKLVAGYASPLLKN